MNLKPSLHPLWLTLLGGVLALGFERGLAFFEWYRLSPYGHGAMSLFSFILLALVVLMMAVPCAMVAGASLFLIGLAKPKLRRWGYSLMGFGGAFVLVFLGTSGLMSRSARTSVTANMSQVAQHSEPLVAAITRYTNDTGQPPGTLDDLVPTYLPSVPGTGLPAYPEYEYSTESERWDGNPWALYIKTSRGMLNWDIFLYLPLQNYPEEGYGGWLQRIEDWAYVHE